MVVPHIDFVIAPLYSSLFTYMSVQIFLDPGCYTITEMEGISHSDIPWTGEMYNKWMVPHASGCYWTSQA